MKEKITKFLEILKIELKDFEEDLLILEELYKQREKKKEITNYVLLENVTVIQREVRGIHRLVSTMDQIAPESYESLDDLIIDLDQRFNERLKNTLVPDEVKRVLKRKLEKVKDFIRNG